MVMGQTSKLKYIDPGKILVKSAKNRNERTLIYAEQRNPRRFKSRHIQTNSEWIQWALFIATGSPSKSTDSEQTQIFKRHKPLDLPYIFYRTDGY